MKLAPKYGLPLMSQIGTQDVIGNRSKKHPDKHLFFMDWLNKTYPNRYKDVKEGDHFILWNGQYCPVPFVQMKDERPDKYNRPTRLNDGSYLSLEPDARVRICPKEEVIQLKKEIAQYYS